MSPVFPPPEVSECTVIKLTILIKADQKSTARKVKKVPPSTASSHAQSGLFLFSE